MALNNELCLQAIAHFAQANALLMVAETATDAKVVCSPLSGLLNEKQAARFLSLSRSEFSAEVESGRLPSGTLIGGTLYWRRQELEEYRAGNIDSL